MWRDARRSQRNTWSSQGLDEARTNDAEEAVLALLRDGETMDTIRMAKAVFGPQATKSDVNPALYSLKEKGLIQKCGSVQWRYSPDQALPLTSDGGAEMTTPDGEERLPRSRLPSRPAPEDEPEEAVPLQKPSEHQLSVHGDTCGQDSPAQLSIQKRLKEAMKSQACFARLADELSPEPFGIYDNLVIEGVKALVHQAIEEIWPGKKVNLRLIGSERLGTAIAGSDLDYAMDIVDGTMLDTELQEFACTLRNKLGLPVEVGGIAIKIEMEPRPIELIPTNGPFNYDIVPWPTLWKPRSPQWNMSEVEANLLSFFNESYYPGAQRAVRIAKAVLLPATQKAPQRPWGLLLEGLAFREGSKLKKEERKENSSGLSLFKRMMSDFLVPIDKLDPRRPLKQVLRDARAIRLERSHKEVFANWSEIYGRI